jgi:hypothetical protein
VKVGSEIDGPATAPDLDGEASKVGLEEVDELFDRFECDLSRFVLELATAAALAASFNLSCNDRFGLCPSELDAVGAPVRSSSGGLYIA